MHSWKVIQRCGVGGEEWDITEVTNHHNSNYLVGKKPSLNLIEMVLISLWWNRDLRRLCRWPALQRTALSGLLRHPQEHSMPAKLDGPWISASTSSQAKFPRLMSACMRWQGYAKLKKPCLLFHGTSCGSPFLQVTLPGSPFSRRKN